MEDKKTFLLALCGEGVPHGGGNRTFIVLEVEVDSPLPKHPARKTEPMSMASKSSPSLSTVHWTRHDQAMVMVD